jgi:hypothetical protein
MRQVDYVAVIVVLLFAMALRILGTATFGDLDDAHLPSTAPYGMLHIQAPMQPDEYLVVAIPVEMVLKNHRNPGFYEYPSGITYLNYVLIQLTGAMQALDKTIREGANLRTLAPFEFYFFSRMYSVLGGVVAVACAYSIMRHVSGKFAAFIAALLLATSYLQVQHAHYTKPEIPSVAFMMLALWASVMALYARRLPVTYRMLLLSGILTGAAATTRYNAAAISIVLCFTGLILLWRHRTWKMLFIVAVAWVLFPITFFIGTPFVLLNFQRFYEEFTYISGQFLSGGNNIAAEILTTPQHGFLILLRFLIVFGITIPATLMIPIGFYAAWQKRSKRFLSNNSELLFIALLVPFIAAYSFVTMRTVRPIFSDNLLVLIVPQCILLAAIGAGWLYENVALPKILLAPMIAIAVLVVPLIQTIPMVYIVAQTETRARMQNWIYEHIPTGSRFLLLESYNVPLDPAIYPYDQNFNISTFQLADVEGYDYLLVSDARLNLYDRADDLVAAAEYEPYQLLLDSINTNFPRIAWIDRPRGYPGYGDMLNMIAYWHQPALTLYCLNEMACAIGSP